MTRGKSKISLCDLCWQNRECYFQAGIVREKCDFYKERKVGMTREELIAELKQVQSSWRYVMDDKLTGVIVHTLDILENENALIDRVIEIIDKWKYDNTWRVREDIWNERMDAIKGEILALKGEQE